MVQSESDLVHNKRAERTSFAATPHQSSPLSENITSARSAQSAAVAAAAGGSTVSSTQPSFCCISPHDDFVQVVRKTSISICMGLSPLPLCFGLYVGYSGFFPSDSNNTLGAKLLSVLICCWSLNIVVPYGYLRWKRHLPTTLMDITMSLHCVFACLVSAIWHAAFVQGFAISIALATILCQTNYILPLSVFLALFYAIDGYNKSYQGTSYELLIPGARYGSRVETLVSGIVAEGCIALAIAGAYLQSQEDVKHVAASRAAVEVCRKIVELLRKYNTEGVTEELKHYDDDVDPDLVKSLKQMNDNLETYKPYLPNYLQHEGVMTSSEGSIILDTLTHSDVEGSVGDRSLSFATDGGGNDTPVSARLSTSGADSPQQAAQILQPPAVGGGGGVQAGSLTMFEGGISFAMVEVPVLHKRTSASINAAAFVECIFNAAEMSKGSVHSLVGDVATITWNATHRVAQPELKATKFLHHLKKHQPMPFGAVVFSGSACCYSITSSKKQHANLIRALWMPMATETFRLACRHKSMLIDERTEAVSGNQFTSMFVDFVCCGELSNCTDNDSTNEPTRSATKRPTCGEKKKRCAVLLAPQLSASKSQPAQLSTPSVIPHVGAPPSSFACAQSTAVFQLLDEITHSEQEWMYQLEFKEKDVILCKKLHHFATDLFSSIIVQEQEKDAFLHDGRKKKNEQQANDAANVCKLIEDLLLVYDEKERGETDDDGGDGAKTIPFHVHTPQHLCPNQQQRQKGAPQPVVALSLLRRLLAHMRYFSSTHK